MGRRRVERGDGKSVVVSKQNATLNIKGRIFEQQYNKHLLISTLKAGF